MAEANGIRDLPKQGVQSILKGFSIDDSERSLPQVPNETLGLSSVSQTLSSSFNQLQRGITNRIENTLVNLNNKHQMKLTWSNCHPQLRTHLTAYQATVRTLHEQNDHNAELFGCLEAAVTEKMLKLVGYVMKKWEKISGFSTTS